MCLRAQNLTVTGKDTTATDIFVDHQTVYSQVTSYGSIPATGSVNFLDATNGAYRFASALLNAADPVLLFSTAFSESVGNGISVVQIGDFNGDGIPGSGGGQL